MYYYKLLDAYGEILGCQTSALRLEDACLTEIDENEYDSLTAEFAVNNQNGEVT